MRKENTILIFGGSGFIGFSLIKKLEEQGYSSIYIGDIKPPKEPLPKGVFYLQCDITDENCVASLFKESSPQVVYNLAGFANLDTAIRFPRKTMDLNVLGNINVLDECVKSDVELFVYASSAYAMNDKGSFYGISKLTSEKIVEEYHKQHNLNYSILRYGSIYAAVDFDNNYLFQLVKSAIETETIIHKGDGEELREYVHVKDVSELSVRVMENKDFWNSSLMLTGNERMKRKELFQMICEIIGNNKLEIQYLDEGYSNHYKYTPYSFQGTSAKKITANPHYDMGQGILECVQKVMETREFESLGE
ncbi:NAD(P)-dependent oxidoreductase [Schleiferiaceae bacterium]|nr:NAD(P)-dependent oxidoreductase [Schleiferiaceae bacterium]